MRKRVTISGAATQKGMTECKVPNEEADEDECFGLYSIQWMSFKHSKHTQLVKYTQKGALKLSWMIVISSGVDAIIASFKQIFT